MAADEVVHDEPAAADDRVRAQRHVEARQAGRGVRRVTDRVGEERQVAGPPPLRVVVADRRVETVASDLGVACGMAFGPDGTLFVGDRSGTVFRVSPTGRVLPFATLPPSVAAYHLAMGPAGRLYVARWPREMRLIDVALLPEFRRHGLGSAHYVRLQLGFIRRTMGVIP